MTCTFPRAEALGYSLEPFHGLLCSAGVLAHGGLGKLEAFDDILIARHLSPGGSAADMLGLPGVRLGSRHGKAGSLGKHHGKMPG
jgi:hypothetical protein